MFRWLQRPLLSRGGVLEQIPISTSRVGDTGTTTYGEWCYTIGLFQSLLFAHMPPATPIRMLDVGCGTGRLHLATMALFGDNDHYTGLDISAEAIAVCRKTYKGRNADFVHVPASNGYYGDLTEGQRRVGWPFEDHSFNLVTATSVWTHLREEDWRFYLAEVSRVLTVGGRAVITFFVLDDFYEKALPLKDDSIGMFYPQPKNKWIFDTPAYGSAMWRTPSWTRIPEIAIAVPEAMLRSISAELGLKVDRLIPGSWKDVPSLWFQDIVAFTKV